MLVDNFKRFAKVYFYLFQSIKNKYLPFFCFFTAEFPKNALRSQSFFAFFAVKKNKVGYYPIQCRKINIFLLLHQKHVDKLV